MKNKKPLPVPKNKRKQSGHGNTQSAVCLVCYDQYKKDQEKNFLFARFNASSLKEHKKVHNCTDNFVSSEDPRAAEAMQTLKKLEKRKPITNHDHFRKLEISLVAKKQKLDPISSQNDNNNSKEVGTVQKSDSQEELSSTNELPSQLDIMEIASHKVINDDLLSKESISCSDSQSLTDVLPVESSSGLGTVKQKQQTSLSNFFPSLPNLPSTQDKLSLDYIADRISEKVCERLKGATADLSEKRVADAADNPNRTSPASNLTDFLHDEHEFELIGENDTWVLRCKICHSYLSNPVASSALKRKPTGDSLATGITLSSDDYSKHIQGNCPEWRRLKHRMLAHLFGSSKTHQNSSLFMKEQMKLHSRKSISIRNQLRTAIGVVQTKCAGIHYETKIAELHQAGADVGDFGHSRNLFPQMIDVACHFIDKETKEYLGTNLPNTGLPPHYYVIADKSTNHRISNQVSMVCPVVQGKKKAIPVAMNPVYTKSDGSGGKGEELADMIYDDLKTHLDIKGSRLLQMQGKVTDGQYINQPFVSKMNKPIFDILSSSGLSDDDLEILLRNMWWECHWDPAHLLDKVFSSFKEDSFVKRFLGRVALFHQIFRHGKMHSIAKETAKEADLPFRVTNAYAPQRFMSSSYLSLKRLEISYEAYVETFLDHHNEAEMRYKLRGSDFVYDLCGLLDLLWPIVQLMLKSQLEWCPGWKFPSYVRLAIAQIELFSSEILKRVPGKNASPRLNKHAEDIIEERYKSVELEPGWIIVGREENGDFIWEAREIKDCQKDLKDLADGMKRELEDRFEKGFPELSKDSPKLFRLRPTIPCH